MDPIHYPGRFGPQNGSTPCAPDRADPGVWRSALFYALAPGYWASTADFNQRPCPPAPTKATHLRLCRWATPPLGWRPQHAYERARRRSKRAFGRMDNREGRSTGCPELRSDAAMASGKSWRGGRQRLGGESYGSFESSQKALRSLQRELFAPDSLRRFPAWARHSWSTTPHYDPFLHTFHRRQPSRQRARNKRRRDDLRQKGSALALVVG